MQIALENINTSENRALQDVLGLFLTSFTAFLGWKTNWKKRKKKQRHLNFTLQVTSLAFSSANFSKLIVSQPPCRRLYQMMMMTFAISLSLYIRSNSNPSDIRNVNFERWLIENILIRTQKLIFNANPNLFKEHLPSNFSFLELGSKKHQICKKLNFVVTSTKYLELVEATVSRRIG